MSLESGLECNTLTASLPTGISSTQLLEREFATFFIGSGSSISDPSAHPPLQALSVNSAATGLQLALQAAGVGPGDEVITSPLNPTSTASVIRNLGASPVFVDIDPTTLNLDQCRIERSITTRTKAILPIHIDGLACDMGSIAELARLYELSVVEDGSQALTSTFSRKPVGTLGSDATVFSLTAAGTETGAECGILVTSSPAFATRCRTMRRELCGHGTGSLTQNQIPTTPSGPLGFRFNLNPAAATAGIAQVRLIRKSQERRALIAARYDDALRELPIILPAPAAEGDLHARTRYTIRLDNSVRITRDNFIREMAELGINCGSTFVPLHLHPYWGDFYHLQPHHFPSAWHAYERAVSLPIYSRMTDQDQLRVIESVQQVVKSAVARPRHSLFFSTAAVG